MSQGEQTVRALREALAVSPDNLPLRKHLAEVLRSLGRFEEAQAECRAALSRSPQDAALKLALAECYFDDGKDSHALVLLDSLKLREEMSAAAHLLHARILVRTGEREHARAAYAKALEGEPALADAELERRLGEVEPPAAERPAEGEPAEEREEHGGCVRQRAQPGSSARRAELERPQAGFSDVGGMQSVKDEIAIKIIQPLLHPELFRAYGKPVGGGILMYGPPGCGKTLLARATAGEVKARFLSIGIHDVLEMWIGQSERNLHAIFEEARRSSPCVLFFDEVDALGARRSDMSGSAGRQVINQFLAELDGVKSSNEGLLVLAATNAPWHLDPAFRRPGRFDRILFVPPPDEAARAAILRVLLHGKPQERVDFERLAARSEDFSGADLKGALDLAVEAKLREAVKRGKPEPLTEKDLAAALKKVQPSTREWFATARNYALYANQGGIYDDIVRYLDL